MMKALEGHFLEAPSCTRDFLKSSFHTNFQIIIFKKIIFTNSSRILTNNTLVIFWPWIYTKNEFLEMVRVIDREMKRIEK